MSSALFSASWYRVAALRPRLRAQARVVRHSYRGEIWHVLQDRASGRFLRLNPAAWKLVALMDGRRTLDQIWNFACARDGDAAPAQDEVVQLLSQLHQANVLVTDILPDIVELGERSRRLRWQQIKQYIANPLAFKFPLFDPDRMLGRTMRLLPEALWTILPWAWGLLVLSAVLQAAVHWDELTADLAVHVFTPENMLSLACVFPVLKAIHELGHGLAIKRFGGACHEMGLMFLVLVPVPYVDATQATGFADKRARMLVGMAGVMAELAVAAVAVWLWVDATPGVTKALLHQVVLLAGITTLVFNLNPLIRFDGYYVLADWLEIPNLGQKANRYLGYLVTRHVFGVEEGLTPPQLTPREGGWLLGYAFGSFLYRMLVAVTIVLIVAERFFFVGVLLAAWGAWSMLAQPLLRQAKFLARDSVLEGRRRRAVLISVGSALALVWFVALVPVASWTVAEGVIWMPEQSQVRAPVACFGAEVRVAPGSMVRAGDVVLSCTDPELDAQYAQLVARLAEIDSRTALAATTDRVQQQIVRAEAAHVHDRIADVRLRREQMAIKAPHDGRFVMSAPGDFPGRFLNRGDVAGYVLDPARLRLLAVVPQGEVDLVRRHTQSVELRSVDRVQELLPARITREVPAATAELPSLALSLAGGGKIGLNPTVAPGSGPTALAPLFQFEIAFSGGYQPRTLGNRVYVRFIHLAEPLAEQWYRSLRQLFLKRFAV